jgi:hypothetical protein
MRKAGYGLPVKEAVVVWYGALRGAIGLALALIVAGVDDQYIPREIKDQFLFLTAGIVTLTLLVNATTIKFLVRRLGLLKVPPAKAQMAINADNFVRVATETHFNKIQNDRYLKKANWDDVKEFLPEESAALLSDEDMVIDTICELRRRILEKGKVIYVGKAKNIKSRVTNHFSYNTNTQSKQRFVHHIYDVDYELCGSEFFAYLTEVHAIKKHWPRFNGAMKRIRLNFGIFTYYDRNGYGRFAVAETSKTNRGILSFRHMSDAWFRIQDLMHEHGLCKRLSGLQETSGACHLHEHGECNGACIKNESATDYNERFAAALTELTTDDSTYIVKSEGRDAEEIGVVLVENGRYKGFGYAPINAALETINAVRQHLQYGYDDQDVQFIVQNHIWNHPTSKVLLVE